MAAEAQGEASKQGFFFLFDDGHKLLPVLQEPPFYTCPARGLLLILLGFLVQ
jgi:hypothetical protein